MKLRFEYWGFIVLFALILTLQAHNIFSYPVSRGFDAGGHIEYIQYLKNYHKLPMANQGWELYQAPLFYFLNTFFVNNNYNYLGIFIWIISSVFMIWWIYRSFNSLRLALLSGVLVGILPVVIYSIPQISNEFFSAVMIGITLAFYNIKYLKDSNIKNSVILGLLIGLALLSKATAVILVGSILIDQFLIFIKSNRDNFFNIKNLKDKIMTLGIVLSITSIVGGWFYFRNFIYFHNPVISSIDFVKFQFSQPPGYRDLRFFTDLSGFIKMDLYHAHWYSLISGTYFSWFYDGHNAILPVTDYSKAGILLIILSLPLFIGFVYGFFRHLFSKSTNSYILQIYTILLMFGYVLYNLKLPFYSTVKGLFMVSLIYSFIYFLMFVIKSFYYKYKYFLWIYLYFYSLIIIKHFWIQDWWY